MIALTSASFLTFANLYFVQPILPLFVKEFSITSTTASLSLSLSVVAMIVGLLFFGFLSDRMGRVSVMIVTLICSILPLLVMPMVSSFTVLLILRFIQGFFIAGLPAAAIAYISEELAPKSVGLGITFYIAANGFGGMGGRVLIGYLADSTSWRMAVYVLFAVGVVLCLLFILYLPKSTYFERSTITIKEDLQGMFIHVKNPVLIPVFSMGIMLQLAFTGIWTYLPFYLEMEPFFLSIKDVSFTYFAYFTGVIGSMVAGRFVDHIPKSTLIISGIITLIIGAFLTKFASLTIIVIGLSILCLGFFVTHSVVAALVNELATHHKGGASSLYLVSYYIGVATGGTASGLVWTEYGWTGVTMISLFLIPVMVWVRVTRQKIPVK